MAEQDDDLKQLSLRLEEMLKKHEAFSLEIRQLREEIKSVGVRRSTEAAKEAVSRPIQPVPSVTEEIRKEPVKAEPVAVSPRPAETPVRPKPQPEPTEASLLREEIEKYIGENLISKIGIAITVLGVAIGTKYAIDHELISPLVRILLGYLFGLGLLFFAIRLRKRYVNFSAVLLSGSMAIEYFMTYAAFSFYALLPQSVAFGLMLVITGFTVASAIRYDRQVIAHIGLVGAYAVPFLLSPDPGKVAVLFIYTAIINAGILVISFKKYWKSLYYAAFIITWLIFMSWYGSQFRAGENSWLAGGFLSLFFTEFYLMFLAYKLLQKEKFNVFDVILLLINSFIFYGVGYDIIDQPGTGSDYLGLFTLGNALVHAAVSFVIYRQKLADKNLFYLVSGLVLIFITIAVPVQLDGNWITLLWAGEAALLFWIGRTKLVRFYEILSYVLVYLSFFSIFGEWAPHDFNYSPGKDVPSFLPFLNVSFLTSVLFSAAMLFINYLHRNRKYASQTGYNYELFNLISYSFAGILILSLYFSCSSEISKYWNHLSALTVKEVPIAGSEDPSRYFDFDIPRFKTIWLVNYSLLFFGLFSLINISKVRDKALAYASLGLNALGMVIFLTLGLYILSELRVSWLNQEQAQFFHRGPFNLWIRYISFVFAAFLLYSTHRVLETDLVKPEGGGLVITFDLLLFTSVIWVLSSELLTWMNVMDSAQSYKLALSILWGICSALLIAYGIWKKKMHLRLGAIVLFAGTLLKLFLYDISHLDTISKTVVFVTLGVLLLIISFLYNKYKALIFSNDSQ